MTRREALTRILEAGKRVFEIGESFTINNMLIANFYKMAELSFDYEGDTGLISMIYVLCEGHVILCMGVDYIKRINVSDSWVMWTDSYDNVYGCVNGEYFRCKEGGE